MRLLRHAMAGAGAADRSAPREENADGRHPRRLGTCRGPRQMIRDRRNDPAESAQRTGWRWRTVPWLSGHHESSVRQLLRFARDDLREWSAESRP